MTPSHVSGFLAALREGDATHRPLTAASAARAMVAVRGLHKFLALDGMTTSDPAREIAPPRAALRLPKAIAVEEVERLIRAAGAEDPVVGLRDVALIEVLYGCGARISEVVGLDVDDVDLDGGSVRPGNGPGPRSSGPPSGPTWAARCRRTPCDTPSPPTCSTGEPTCAWSRSCSGMPR